MKTRTLSLRARLAGMLAILFIGGALALYVAAQTYGQTAANHAYDRLLAGSVLSIAETLSIDGHAVDVDIPYAALDMLSAAPDDRVFYRVFGPGNLTVTGYRDLPLLEESWLGDGAAGVDTPQFFDALYRGELVRFALLGREIAQSDIAGWIWVQVGQTRRARDALAQDLVLRSLASIVLMTILALSLVWFGVARALRPLQRVGQDLARRQPEELQPLSEPVPAEIVPLIDAINGFMRRLGTNIDALRAFIAEAAHQMRTPLAALRVQAQVGADDDPQELRRSLDAVERNAEKLSRLLNQLLSDATVIHRSDVRRFEPFDLLHVVRHAIKDVVPLSRETGIHLQTELERAPYMGDGLMLGEALKNLIDNALQHGSDGHGTILIELGSDGAGYDLVVSDRGLGIAAADRERVFERFARGESAAPGAGLGLAIVRRAVESHGGAVTLSDREGGGLCVRLRLPTATLRRPQ